MITIRFSGRMPSPVIASIGMETDSRAEKIRFLLPQIANGQTAQLMMLLPDGTPEMLQINSGMVTVPSTVLEIPGRIRAWVEILGSDSAAWATAWNSELFYLDVGDLPPISEKTEHKYPTAIQDAMEAAAQALLYRDEAQSAAALAIDGHGGMLHFEMGDDGHLYLYFTEETPLTFALEEGELILYGN